MVVFGQLVVGPPGAGKTTYCNGMQQLLGALKRPCIMINLDPANDDLPYSCDIDIRELVNVEDVMTELGLGPNGALVYAMQYIEVNLDWLIVRVREATASDAVPYVFLDCPGQVELYTHHDVMTTITGQLAKVLDMRLVAVHLIDSTLCVDAYRYLSAVLLSLSAMMQMELPHINVLSKIDMLMDHTDDLSFRLDYYTTVDNLSHLLRTVQTIEHPLSQKFGEFTRLMADLIEDYGLVSFEPLDIQDRECALRLLSRCDTSNGHVMNAEKIHDPSDPVSGIRLLATGFSDSTEPIEDYLERYEERLRARNESQAEERENAAQSAAVASSVPEQSGMPPRARPDAA
jgi:GTPase SAR1 family protein